MKRARARLNPTVWRIGVTLLLIALLGYLLVTHHAVLGQSWHALRHAQTRWLLLALIGSIGTFVIAASIYVTLALHSLRFGRTLLIEIAASFVNRLVPAGLGGLGLHGLYLHRQKHSVAEATAVVSINNALGIIAHLSLLIAACIFQPNLVRVFSRHVHGVRPLYLVLALAVIAAVCLLPAIQTKLLRFGKNLLTSLRRLQLRQIGEAYLKALLLTTCYSLTLYASARAVGIDLSLLRVFIVFSIGMLVGTATPTPGGLVGIEAGLYGGFVSYGIASGGAAAIVLIYRLATYWLPLLPGGLALLYSRQRKLV